MNGKTDRIQWIDVYKGIVIILVVVGHSTGMFNHFIYQFHVAAFFFISGYVSKINERKMSQIVINKLLTLAMPLTFFTSIGGVLLLILESLEKNEFLWGQNFIGLRQYMKCYFTDGSIYAQFLGACWFLVILFGAIIFEKFLLIITGNCETKRSIGLFVLVTIVQTIIAYYNLGSSFIQIPNYRLYLIAGAIIAWGILTLKTVNKVKFHIYIQIIGTMTSIGVLFIFAKEIHKTVDIAMCNVNTPILDFIMQFNGIVLVIGVSNLICAYLRFLVPGLSYIGKNTMSILIGHFLVFKLYLLWLKLQGVIENSDVARIVPTAEVGNKYWIVFTFLGVVIPLFIWGLLKRIPVVAFLIGERRVQYKVIENRICSWKIVRILDEVEERILSITRNKRAQYIGSGICAVFLLLWSLEWYNQNYSDVVELSGKKWISQRVSFEEGFYPKGNGETYVWVEQCGIIKIDGELNGEIKIVFCVPKNFTEITKVDFYVNDIIADSVSVTNESQEVLIEMDAYVDRNSDNYVKIYFDGIHKPSDKELDKREMSGLISYISIKK